MNTRPVKIGQKFNMKNQTKSDAVTPSSQPKVVHGFNGTLGASKPQQSKSHYPILVNIQDSAGNIICNKFDIRTLRRYSGAASAQFSSQFTTPDPQAQLLGFTISYVGFCVPSKAASAVVMQWMIENKGNTLRPTPLSLDFLTRSLADKPDLNDKVQVIAVADGIGLRPYPAELVQATVQSIRKDPPMSAAEFKIIWDLLPPTHAIVEAAIGNLVHCWRYEKLDEDVNWELEEMMLKDDELHAAFEVETNRQMIKHEDWLRHSRGDGNVARLPA